MTGLGLGASWITYSGLAGLNISLGSGGNTFTIASTYSATATTLNSGNGNDTVNVGSTANVLDGIQGALTLNGMSHLTGDTLNITATGNAANHQYGLTDTTFSRDGMAMITYGTFEALNVSLGSGKNTFTINNISPTTVTTVNGGSNAGNTLAATFTPNFAGTLNVTGFPTISSIATTGNFAGTMTVGAPSNIVSITVGGNFTGQLLSAGTHSQSRQRRCRQSPRLGSRAARVIHVHCIGAAARHRQRALNVVEDAAGRRHITSDVDYVRPGTIVKRCGRSRICAPDIEGVIAGT